MLADKPKLTFTDIAGKVTHVTRLPCQQIKVQCTPTQTEKYNTALYLCGESTA